MPRFAESAIQYLAGLDAFPQPPIIPLRTPVMLMHGFGIMAALQQGGYLHQEAMHLRKSGVRAYAPNVAPYDSIPARANMWKKRVEHILGETRADTLTLIAHSMGGLDARYLITKLGLHDQVEALVTVSTPHRGTSIAKAVLNQPGLIRDGLASMANYIGAKAIEDGTSDVLKAVAELTPEYIQGTFNPSVPDHPSVRYWSYAGQAGKGTDVSLDPFFRLLNSFLYKHEGVNDGYTAVDSARWGTFLGTIDADHARQIGVASHLGSPFDSYAFFADIVRMLAEEGF
jgi:triacylglycerol lipase